MGAGQLACFFFLKKQHKKKRSEIRNVFMFMYFEFTNYIMKFKTIVFGFSFLFQSFRRIDQF